jgi:predicted transcriptional regulator
MAAYGLVRMERGKGLRLVPRLIHDRVELVLPLAERRKTKGTRK